MLSRNLIHKAALALLLSAGLLSCSVEKNTSLSRNYHGLVSHYNIYFNGKESYLKGIEKANTSVNNDYTQILDVFVYEDEGVNTAVSGDMKRAIDKATKVITFHSITSKPKVKQGDQSAKDKAFYEKNEYNKWVDDSYMLMGKSYMYQGEFFLAAETFKHVLLTFPKEDVSYLGKIWLTRAYIMIGEEREAERLLMNLEDDPDFPEDYLREYYTSRTQYHLKNEDYAEAARYLHLALEKKGLSKEEKIRFTYILAQLYEEAEQNDLALKNYKQVTRYNPPYEMFFNARVSMAEVYKSGNEDSDDLKKLLHKMLKDSKNKEYLDQIYFALGNMSMEEGKRDEAIEYYSLSVSSSVHNQYQKGFSSLTLAELYYEDPDYILSAAYYDSAVTYLNREFPGYPALRVRSSSLGNLVQNVTTYEMQDSVQNLARMSEEERYAVIDAIIEDVRMQEEEARLAEQQAMEDMAFNQSMLYDGGQTSQAGGGTGVQWYFYNLSAKSSGQPEFRMKWGDRKLEDNWRRRNRQSMSDLMGVEGIEGDTALNGEAAAIMDNKSREYYLANIPLNDSAMEVSDRKLENALFNMGVIYKEDLLDYNESITSFQELLKRYPDTEHGAEVHYYLYQLSNNTQNPGQSKYHAEQLSILYPESHYAKLLNNPNYLKELEEEEMKVVRFYESIYELYTRKNYTAVINGADSAMVQYPGDPLIPKFRYIQALSIGALQGKEEMKVALDTLIAQYPATEEGKQAQEIVSYMYVEFPEIKEAAQAAEAAELYTEIDSAQAHYFLLVLDGSRNVNQVSFDLLNYHLDYYNEYNLEIIPVNVDDHHHLLAVEAFTNAEAAGRYMDDFRNHTGEVLKGIGPNLYEMMIISEDNFKLLTGENEYRPYYLFYLEHYLKQK